MSNRWLTKQDILDDLAEATGKRVTNIDDRFAVRGECPPPVNVPDEEEDELLQFYEQYTSKNCIIEQPDCPGITHMLRMVEDYYDRAKCDDNINLEELKKAADTVITISKLNPNVPEFIPKSETKTVVENGESNKSESPSCLEISKSSSKMLGVKQLDRNDEAEINKTDASHNNETNNNDIDVTKKIDISNLNSNDIKNLTEKLKQKIVGTSKNECLTKKRERNLAMASLLKLYTSIPKSPKKSQPMKLMTPDYFQTLPEDVPSKSVRSETNQTKIEQNIKEEIRKETNTKEEEIDNSIKPASKMADPESSSSKSNSRESSDLSGNKILDTNIEKERNDLLMSKEVAESVKKVDKWLNGPEKKKQKASGIFFGPVTYKRKENGSMKSAESQSLSINETERPSSTHTIDSFVPSAYAEELTKSYMERSQSKAVQNENIWTKLERQLQEKDKAIREKQLAKQNQQ